MARDDVRDVRRVPGRLAVDCTDLSLEWPHGGTGLGSTAGCTLTRFGGSYPITVEAFGGEPVEYLEEGAVYGLGCVLRTWNDDMLQTMFRNTVEGQVSQRRLIKEPSTVRAGNWMSPRARVLVFTPEGSTHAEDANQPDTDAPFIVLYRAIPLVEDTAELYFERAVASFTSALNFASTDAERNAAYAGRAQAHLRHQR